ncbi:Pentatricopeptide repeat-containing protein [Thalictrum thalictroides]|uniref:Pentatricopeptide repeat-containing protein n=1 Tax=Thalictrum thalictroides TaxID=46969 RepID=A0A7J6W845_THATH|nr:Pentatricopeptide repeat-containing protein [Thalictrum thalictroides]
MTSWSIFLQQNLSQVQKYIPRSWKKPSPQPLFQQKLSHFEEKLQLDSISLSLKTFANQGNLFKAFESYSFIQNYVSSSTSSYSLLTLHSICSLLICCTTFESFSQGKQLHAHIITLGFEQNHVLVPKLVTFYSKFGHLSDAYVITLNSKKGCSFSWNLLISGYVKYGFWREAISVYKQMVSIGVRTDKFTYPSVLKACGNELDLRFGREVHRSIYASCHEKDYFVQNALVTMYIKFGKLKVAHDLFDKMPVKDVVSWNTMISAYSSKGMWQEAFMLIERMQMNTVTWNVLAGGCLETHNYKGALELISQMRYHGAELDCVTTVIGLSACSQTGFLKVGKEIHGFAVRSCSDGIEIVKNALIIMFSRCNDLGHAHVLFRSTKAKTLTTWNSIIAGCIYLARYDEASFIFREMLSTEVKPNYVTMASILPYCARTMNLFHGKEIHCCIIKQKELRDHLLLWNSLVELYSKSGKMLESQRIFDSMHEKDRVTYTSLIAGYGMQGQGQVALLLFEEMNRRRIKPDYITMVAVLSACSHSGLVVEGQMMFERMVNEYKISPQMEHFACMVNLFGNVGLLNRAAQMIIEMPFKPSHAMLATLIRACRIRGNTHIMEWATTLLDMRTKE